MNNISAKPGSRGMRWFALAAFLASLILLAHFWHVYHSPLPARLAGTAADPSVFMNQRELDRAAEYAAFRDTLFFVSYFWEWGILFWMLAGGFAARVLRRLEHKLPSLIVRFPAYVVLITGAWFALALPVRLVSYALARYYGISALSAGGWLRDQLVGLAVNCAIMIAVFAVVFLLIRKNSTIWFRLWLLAIPFLIFYTMVKPLVIDPLFYRYEPLSDPQLERAVLDMTERAGVPAERVYMADYSRKTNAINAYVDGFGPSLRIVIWDTALQKLSKEEIMVLTAHEIAHYVMRHLGWSAAGGIISAGIMLLIGERLYRFLLNRWGARLSIRSPGDWAALPLMILIVSVLTFAATPVTSAVSRQAEQAADRYAYELTGDAEAAISLYRKLALSSRSVLHPAPLSYWFRYTHPSLGMRMMEAERYGAAKR